MVTHPSNPSTVEAEMAGTFGAGWPPDLACWVTSRSIIDPSLKIQKIPADGTHSGFNENGSPLAHVFEYLVPSWWEWFKGSRGVVFVGRSVSLGVGLEGSKDWHHFRFSQPPAFISR